MRRVLISGIIALTGAVFMTAPLAGAATTTPKPSATPAPNGSAGQGLEISPPVIELNADPGQTITTSIRVRNVTKGDLIAKGQSDDFGPSTSEDGQPKLLLDETGATRYSLKYWISGVPDLRLAPDEVKTSQITIKVPANAEPGGHFGVVRFTAVPPDMAGTGVALSASVGSLILLKVSGAINDNLSVAELSAVQNGKTGRFFEHGPLDFLVRLKNDGSVHEKPKGAITVKSWTGKTVATVAVNPKGGNVLPSSVRRFVQTLDQKQLFGHYTANLALTYANNKKLTASLGFWVIPWKLVLLIVLALIVVAWLLRIGIKRYNEHIIAMARRR